MDTNGKLKPYVYYCAATFQMTVRGINVKSLLCSYYREYKMRMSLLYAVILRWYLTGQGSLIETLPGPISSLEILDFLEIST